MGGAAVGVGEGVGAAAALGQGVADAGGKVAKGGELAEEARGAGLAAVVDCRDSTKQTRLLPFSKTFLVGVVEGASS